MSLFKRIWIERDPAYEEFRRAAAGGVATAISAYPYPAPLRRRNRQASSPRWDPTWPELLRRAVSELGMDSITINSKMMFRSELDRDGALARGEYLWASDIQRRDLATQRQHES